MSETMRGRGWGAAAWRMVAFAAAMVAGAAAKADTLVPWADSTWKYRIVTRGAEPNFQESWFDDSAWPTGRAPFAEGNCGWPAPPNTAWQPGTDLIARMRLSLDCSPAPMRVRIAIDNAVRVWVNGVDISQGMQSSGGCAVRDRFIFNVPPGVLVEGDNLIAVRAADYGGSAYFDASIERDETTQISAAPAYVPVFASVLDQPATSVRFTATLGPGASCPGGVTLRWQRRNASIPEENRPDSWLDVLDGPMYQGAETAELTILQPTPDLAVPHRCTVRLPCLCANGGIAIRRSNPVSFGMVQNVATWGANEQGQQRIPGGVIFDQVVSSGPTSLGLRSDGTLVAWGSDHMSSVSAVPSGRFASIAGGWQGFAAIRIDGTAVGWGDFYHCATCPPSGTFRKVALAFAGGMGIRTDGSLVSWGSSGIYTTNVPSGRFIDLAINDVCYAIRDDGTAIRFGARMGDPPPVELFPDVRFSSVHIGNGFAILLARDGTLRGDGGGPGASVPSGTFRSVAAGHDFAVAVRTDGSLTQWGSVPGPAPARPPSGFRRVAAGTYAGTAFAFTTDACADLGSITILREPANLSISPAGQAVLSIEATGPMPLTYRWRRNGLSLSNDARFSGVDSPVLTINGFRSEDQARYDCVLSDQCRLTISRAADVSCRPFISGQPQGADVAAGLAIRLGVEVTTGGSISYRWRRNGVNLFASPRYLGVNTGLLTILTDDPNDSGLYSAVATNACGTTTSVAAQVTVFCAADFNQDGGIDGSDVAAFFENWERGEMSADVNADGGIDGSDVDFFFDRWERGC